MVLAAMTTNEIILAIVCAVLVIFSLTVSMVVPKRNPDFPRRRVGAFLAVAAVLVIAMLAAVEVVGEEEEAEAAETAEPAEVPAEGPAPTEEPAPTETAPAETSPEEPAPTETEPGSEPPPAETVPPEPPAPAGDPAAGKAIFTGDDASCYACHALADASATGAIGPNLDDSKPPYELVIDRVTNGQGGMPPFGDLLSEQQIQDVAAYVVQATSG
jgi:sulfite dehydrogenase